MSLMSILGAIASSILFFFSFIWMLFLNWLWIFIVPFTSIDSIWLIVPVWLSWFFAEIYQEKEGTSFGNAISNGVVPLWAGIDWIRYLTQTTIADHDPFTALLFTKYFISVLAVAFGLLIIISGIKGKDYVHFAGRIRVVTYIVAVFTTLVYDLVRMDYKFFCSVLLFFPAFYLLIEWINVRTPTPKVVKLDVSGASTKMQPYSSNQYPGQRSPQNTSGTDFQNRTSRGYDDFRRLNR